MFELTFPDIIPEILKVRGKHPDWDEMLVFVYSYFLKFYSYILCNKKHLMLYYFQSICLRKTL
jgi:hypothetical protein